VNLHARRPGSSRRDYSSPRREGFAQRSEFCGKRAPLRKASASRRTARKAIHRRLTSDKVLTALEQKLHSDWMGDLCDGTIAFYANGTYQRQHYGPGNAILSGNWSVWWDALPLTLVMTRMESEDPEFVGKTTEMKLISLDGDKLDYKFSKETPDQRPRRYTREKE
jgi:hypothetical protein